MSLPPRAFLCPSSSSPPVPTARSHLSEEEAAPPIHEEEVDVEEEATPPSEEMIEDLFDPVAEARRAFNQFDSDGSGTLNIRFPLSPSSH